MVTDSKVVSEQTAQSVAKEGPKPLPAKRRKLMLKVGESVCVHSSSLHAKCHLACRVVKEVGDCYQLYCSKGVLNTLFLGSELTKLSSNCLIPLDKWRQAPRVSLGNVIGDPAALEHCDCNLLKCSEPPVVLSSASEDENTENKV